ncbi:MAG: YidC/Oxa1 family membrane protein insertase, partial [Thermoanaerobaculia bacterium]
RRLFQMMPIFFTVLFLGFPSGLVLYWLTNNVLGIAQQAAYQRARELKEAPKKGSSGRKPKRGASR